MREAINERLDEAIFSKQKQISKPRPVTIVFPLVLKLPIVAKYLCAMGQNDNRVDWDKPHELFLEREPSNFYDRKAIRLAVL